MSAGTTVIRAYGHQERFISESELRVYKSQMCFYPGIIATRWLSVRLEVIGSIVLLTVTLWAVIARDAAGSCSVGLTITYALQVTQTLSMLVQMSSEIETNIVSVERVQEYCHTQVTDRESGVINILFRFFFSF